jgi:hypothetical protein
MTANIATEIYKMCRRILDAYSGKKYSIEYAPVIIISDMTKYILKYPLRCLFKKEENYFVIQSEMLNIIGTGLTQDEAETSFSEEFDYLYKRLQSLESKFLTNHNLLIKNILNQYIDKVE